MANDRVLTKNLHTTNDKDAIPVTSRLPKQLDNCVICLEEISERAIVLPCNHCAFDFICIVSWLEERRTCPLCNTYLTAVQYDFRSPFDIKTYNLPDAAAEKASEPSDVVGNRQFFSTGRYLTRWDRLNARPFPAQQSHATNRPFNNRRRPNFDRRQPHGISSASTISNASERPVEPHHSPLDPLADAITRRRHIYRQQLYSMYVGSNRVSRYKDFTPKTFTKSRELQSRAQKWIRRELQAFDFLSPSADNDTCSRRASNAEFLLSYVLSVLKTLDIKGSNGKAEELLAEFLGQDNARIFLHDLEAWLRSPYTALEDWDRNVQYPSRNLTKT